MGAGGGWLARLRPRGRTRLSLLPGGPATSEGSTGLLPDVCFGEPGASPARGSTAASWGRSSSEVFYPGKMFRSVLSSLCWSPAQKFSSLSRDHSSPSSNAGSSGVCFTVVLWELPFWLKSMPESPRRRRTSDGETGRWSSTRLACWSPQPHARGLQLPHPRPLQEYGLGARTAAGRHTPAGPREGLCHPISCKHTAPSLP